MNIIFYCQYVWGMGHFIRSLEFARALSDHIVTLVAGGQKVEVVLPDHVQLVRLPALYMDEKFTTLIPGNPEHSLEQIQSERKKTLKALFEQQKPDVFVVELYPFGRSIFAFELEPLLAEIREGKFGHVKVVCSLRDILVEKKDPAAYEKRVLQKLNRNFDALLVHSDPHVMKLNKTFTRLGDISIPVVYTGFITQRADPAAGARLRDELGICSGEKLIVASAGGGRSGYKLLSGVIDACKLLRAHVPARLEAFAGPFMQREEFGKLSARASTGLRVRRYTKRFMDYLLAADLSVSLAGYNTCMNLLVTQVPCLVFPYSRQREQPMRVAKIKSLLPMRILGEDALRADRLSDCMTRMLSRKRDLKPFTIDLDGAAKAARFLEGFRNYKR
jgi:predicted glycosyltransferase